MVSETGIVVVVFARLVVAVRVGVVPGRPETSPRGLISNHLRERSCMALENAEPAKQARTSNEARIVSHTQIEDSWGVDFGRKRDLGARSEVKVGK